MLIIDEAVLPMTLRKRKHETFHDTRSVSINAVIKRIAIALATSYLLLGGGQTLFRTRSPRF